MRLPTVLRSPKLSTVAMLALIVAGCENSDPRNDLSTDANLTEDAAADDVLGANDVTAAQPATE